MGDCISGFILGLSVFIGGGLGFMICFGFEVGLESSFKLVVFRDIT